MKSKVTWNNICNVDNKKHILSVDELLYELVLYKLLK